MVWRHYNTVRAFFGLLIFPTMTIRTGGKVVLLVGVYENEHHIENQIRMTFFPPCNGFEEHDLCLQQTDLIYPHLIRHRLIVQQRLMHLSMPFCKRCVTPAGGISWNYWLYPLKIVHLLCQR